MLNNQIRIGQVAAVILAVLLVVPYATGALDHLFFVEGLFPIRPRNYLLGIVALLALYALANRPRINLCILALLSLFVLRIADTLLLHRVANLDESNMLSSEEAALVYSVGIVFLCGNGATLRYSALLCGIFTILVCCVINGWEWHNPGFFSTVEGRSAGMLENPTTSSLVIVALLGVVLALAPPLWLAAGLICASGLGVYFTLSRGGAITWLLVVAAYLAFIAKSNLRRLVGFAFWLALIVVLVLKVVDVGNALGGSGSSGSMEDVSTREKVLFGQEEMDANDNGRVDLLMEGLKAIQQEPILGYGTGASFHHIYNPHNEFIGVWLDNGILGAALYAFGLCLLVGNCLVRNKALLIGCIPIIVEITASQTLLEDKGYLFAWVVLAGMAQLRTEADLPAVCGAGRLEPSGDDARRGTPTAPAPIYRSC